MEREALEFKMIKGGLKLIQAKKQFEVEYPFLNDPRKLSNNLGQAISIAMAEEWKLPKEGLTKEFNEKFEEYLNLGTIEVWDAFIEWPSELCFYSACGKDWECYNTAEISDKPNPMLPMDKDVAEWHVGKALKYTAGHMDIVHESLKLQGRINKWCYQSLSLYENWPNWETIKKSCLEIWKRTKTLESLWFLCCCLWR